MNLTNRRAVQRVANHFNNIMKLTKRDLIWKAILATPLAYMCYIFPCFATIYGSVGVVLAYNFPEQLFNRIKRKLT